MRAPTLAPTLALIAALAAPACAKRQQEESGGPSPAVTQSATPPGASGRLKYEGLQLKRHAPAVPVAPAAVVSSGATAPAGGAPSGSGPGGK